MTPAASSGHVQADVDELGRVVLVMSSTFAARFEASMRRHVDAARFRGAIVVDEDLVALEELVRANALATIVAMSDIGHERGQDASAGASSAATTVTVAQVAELLGVSERQARRVAGALPGARRLGRQIVAPLDEVLARRTA